MFVSKRALSKVYLKVDKEEKKKLIELEKELDNYVVVEKLKDIEVKKKVVETSVLLQVEKIPREIEEKLKGYERELRVKIFVSSHEEDVKINRFREI